MTLLEKAKALGATITRKQVGSYPVYRVNCSTCFVAGERPSLPRGSNYSSRDIGKAMNDHARRHLREAKKTAPEGGA